MVNYQIISVRFMVYIYSSTEWKKFNFLIFKVIKSRVPSEYTAQLSGQEKNVP